MIDFTGCKLEPLNEDQFFIYSMHLLDGDDYLSVSKYFKRATQPVAVQLLHDLLIPDGDLIITDENCLEVYAQLSHYILKKDDGIVIDLMTGSGQQQYQQWKKNRGK